MKLSRCWRPALFCALILGLSCAVLLAAAPAVQAQEKPAPKELRILCSFFPIHQFTQNVIKGREGARAELMLPATLGCPHDYLLTPQDIEKIARADVLILNGYGLESFLNETVRQANSRLKIIEAGQGINDVLVAQCTHEAHEGHHHHEHDVNPHLFTSPRLAARMARQIAAELGKLDPAGAALYTKNAEAYAAQLEALGKEFAETAKTLRSRKIVTMHNVFDYLARDAGLEVVAVVEENPGQEPSAAQMLDLIARIKKSGAAAVFTEPQYPAAIGQTIAREAGLPVATLDPVANGPATAPLDYYQTVMHKNLATLKEALGEGH